MKLRLIHLKNKEITFGNIIPNSRLPIEVYENGKQIGWSDRTTIKAYKNMHKNSDKLLKKAYKFIHRGACLHSNKERVELEVEIENYFNNKND